MINNRFAKCFEDVLVAVAAFPPSPWLGGRGVPPTVPLSVKERHMFVSARQALSGLLPGVLSRYNRTVVPVDVPGDDAGLFPRVVRLRATTVVLDRGANDGQFGVNLRRAGKPDG